MTTQTVNQSYIIGEKVKVVLTMDAKLYNGGGIYSDENGNDYFVYHNPKTLKGMKEGDKQEVYITIKDYYRFHDGWKTLEEMKQLYPEFTDKRYVVGKVSIK